MKKLLIVVNVDWFFISHRLIIAERAKKEGWDVYVACEDTGRKQEIIDKGINFVDFVFSRSGTNLFSEFKTILKFMNIYSNIKPDIVHHVTLKPVIYGSLIAKLLKIRGVLNAISGLGYNFTGDRKSFVQKVMIRMMKFGFNRENLTIIFQNDDDRLELQKLNILDKRNQIVKIKGSGVELDKYVYCLSPKEGKIIILFPVRMLWDKGVKELRGATDILKDKYQKKIKFVLAGIADTDNIAGVTKEYLESWSDGEYVDWVGYQKEMVELYAKSHIVVLPSYREGMPKTLIEACATGRAIVTTDAIGCRECVDEGINGFKVPVYSEVELAEAIEKLLNDRVLIDQMGINSRKKAEKEFNVELVISKHLDIYSDLI